ncbi:MAG TPA: Uma2 family endonuclease [Polyangiaceae bacterium]|nr:Uma2 family endonuclease [Polyangiaceae bacterium]
MTAASSKGFTEAEYLALESAGVAKHEFVDGAILVMAGATPPHNALAVNVTVALAGLARAKKCLVLNSDQRVHVPATGIYVYPDVTVAWGERRYKNDNPPSLLNPTLLVEVTSDSSEDYDRGSKFLHYQAIESLREYVIVSHRERRIDHHRRLDSGQWLATPYLGDEANVELAAPGGTVRLADVYGDVDLDEGRG